MIVTPANENNRGRAFVELFRPASLPVAAALGCVSLNTVAARANGATPGEQPQARQRRLSLKGKKENIDRAVYKPGQYVEQREQHTSVFIIGNERTGLWKKAFGRAQPDELIEIVASVLDDKPAATTTTNGGK
ncbi:MAG: hypothetical protein LC803_07945 [Acidobacteria bacterium]|nr:hypothetical protein [Acidobacteriota bacterium]